MDPSENRVGFWDDSFMRWLCFFARKSNKNKLNSVKPWLFSEIYMDYMG